MWTVVFPKKLYQNLSKFLFSTAPYENGCLLLANSYKTKTDSVLLVTNVIQPNKNSCDNSNEDSFVLNSSFINDGVMAAESANSSLILVHTHPNSLHPSTFSWIDKKSNAMIFNDLSQILPNKPLGSMVFSQKGICGVVFNKNRLQDVKQFKVVGDTISEFPGVGFTKRRVAKPRQMFDRQIRTFGEQNQSKLQDLVITIVGVGGTGSSVAIQLARMGVKKLLLVDMDTIDKTNLTRIYGSSSVDIGKPKVEVLQKHIKTFSKATINAICADVKDQNVCKQILRSDIIFACTDNHTSRSILNDISYRYYIPLIDVGCSIYHDGNNPQPVSRVQVVTPDSACLWCTDTLDGEMIRQESLPEKKKKKLAQEGYYNTVEKQPSIISLTTMTASIAINKFLNLIGAFEGDYNSRIQIELNNGSIVDDRPLIRANCVCQKEKGLAQYG